MPKQNKRRHRQWPWLLCLLAGLLLNGPSLFAQDITVTNFYMADHDLTASDAPVHDQNGNICALIRVQSTMKGFHFDVGSLGVQKVEDNHPSEIWVYVPHGVRHMSIHHAVVGSLPNYDFPITIEAARTYIMEITTKQVFVNTYDDTRKQKLIVHIEPSISTFTLNGMRVSLDKEGNTTQELSLGTYTYKIENDTYYPKEGQITIDDPENPTYLTVTDLKPIMGKVSVHVSPHNAEVLIDGQPVTNSSIEPLPIQIGQHSVEVKAPGYRGQSQSVTISENRTSDISISLSQLANYKFETRPANAKLWINDSLIGYTPSTVELTTGTYRIQAEHKAYKRYDKQHQLSSDDPNVQIKLLRIYNFRNEFYIEGNYQVGNLSGMGASVGVYVNNFNVEAGYLMSTSKTETVYWNTPNDQSPSSAKYKPTMRFTGKVGYGFPVMTRMRVTPQLGFAFVKTKAVDYVNGAAVDGAYASSALASVRLSYALMDYLALSLTPEYAVAVTQSDGYKVLSDFLPTVKNWSEGFNVKLGISLYF
ncbi:MAG: PEGA domain-containing protein [Parabacteroides sp.]